MGILEALQGLFRKKQDDDDLPYSIVMLLRSPFTMSEEVLTAAASRAYGVPYDGSQEMYFVMRSPQLTVVDFALPISPLAAMGRVMYG
jgi:hypothetical protein